MIVCFVDVVVFPCVQQRVKMIDSVVCFVDVVVILVFREFC